MNPTQQPKESPAAFGRRLAKENLEAEKHFNGSYHSGGMDDSDIQGVIMAAYGLGADSDLALEAYLSAVSAQQEA